MSELVNGSRNPTPGRIVEVAAMLGDRQVAGRQLAREEGDRRGLALTTGFGTGQ
jgi:hypothetical protein